MHLKLSSAMCFNMDQSKICRLVMVNKYIRIKVSRSDVTCILDQGQITTHVSLELLYLYKLFFLKITQIQGLKSRLDQWQDVSYMPANFTATLKNDHTCHVLDHVSV